MLTYSKKLYYERKNAGLCVKCGCVRDNPNSITCNACAKIDAEYRRAQYSSIRNDTVEKKRTTYKVDGLSLHEVMDMAADNGLSYGQMTAMLDGYSGLRTEFH